MVSLEKWGPSSLCQQGQHDWCFNRSPEETHCGCPCHVEKEQANRLAQIRKFYPVHEAVLERVRQLEAMLLESRKYVYGRSLRRGMNVPLMVRKEDAQKLLEEIDRILAGSPLNKEENHETPG